MARPFNGERSLINDEKLDIHIQKLGPYLIPYTRHAKKMYTHLLPNAFLEAEAGQVSKGAAATTIPQFKVKQQLHNFQQLSLPATNELEARNI